MAFSTDKQDNCDISRFSLATLFVSILCLVLFGIYIGTLLYGKNSLTVLNQLKETKSDLHVMEVHLKVQNQKLQKDLFELQQLEPQS